MLLMAGFKKSTSCTEHHRNDHAASGAVHTSLRICIVTGSLWWTGQHATSAVVRTTWTGICHFPFLPRHCFVQPVQFLPAAALPSCHLLERQQHVTCVSMLNMWLVIRTGFHHIMVASQTFPS